MTDVLLIWRQIGNKFGDMPVFLPYLKSTCIFLMG